MRIGTPEIAVDGEWIRLQATVTLESGIGGFPDKLWFRFPVRFASLVSRRFDPFVVCLSSVASALHEDIEIEGTISERLHHGLHEYWTIFHRWFPGDYSPPSVRAQGYEREEAVASGAGTAFSGGVDSFFSLFKHLPARETRPSFRLTHALFIHGFDIPLSDTRTFAAASGAYEAALLEAGVTLVTTATNLRQFVDRSNWEISHGSALIGTALLLAPALRRFFVPSSKSYVTLEPWGSDPLVDGLLSTDQFHVIHDGAEATRFDKLHAMREWPLIRPMLRTCWVHPDGLRNCGRCYNCLRTMYVLASLGILDQFTTFPGNTPARALARASWSTPHERMFGKQSIEAARNGGHTRLAIAGRSAMAMSRLRTAWLRMKGQTPP